MRFEPKKENSFKKYLCIAFVLAIEGCTPSTQTSAPTLTLVPGQPVASAQPSLPTQTSIAPKVSVAATSWSTRAPLPQPNSELAVAELNGKIYVIGGYPSTRITVAAVQVYDTKKDSWELTTPLPRPLNHAMAAAVGGKLYVIGGQTDPNVAYVDTVYEFNPATAAWTMKAPMPTLRSAGAAVVLDGRIFVVGGRPPRGNDFAVYDPRENVWTSLPNLPTQRNHLAAAAINGKIYVAGGRFGGGFDSEVTDVLEMFDPGTKTWTRKSPMPTARGGVNGIQANGCFHVWGGEGQNKDHPLGVFPEHEVYNPVNDTWRRLDNMPVPIHGVSGAAFVDGWIHIPGGGTSYGGSSGSTIHQVYRAEMRCQ